MKLLDIEINQHTMRNITIMFWHGNQDENQLSVLGIQEGFDLMLFEKVKFEGVKPISLTEKGYVMARAHFYVERTSLLELEKSLYRARDRLTESYEDDKDLVPHNFDRYEDQKDG